MTLRMQWMLSLCLILGGAAIGCGDDDDAADHDHDAATGEHDGHEDAGNKPTVKDPDSKDAAADPQHDGGEPHVEGIDDEERPDDTDQSEARAFNDDAGEGFRSLIEGQWELPANTESYRCIRFTVPEDLYISEFRPLTPVGTHHTVLTVSDEPTGEDGITECGAGNNAPGGVFGSGVGTGDMVYPEGIAMHLRKGQQLLLNLHLFNTKDTPLKGVSGTLFKALEKDDVTESASMILAGPVGFTIPKGSGQVIKGQCTMDRDVTLIAVAPHMHQIGVHLKAVADSSVVGETMLIDSAYSFEEQVISPLEEIPMKKGDVVRVECTYDNDTDRDVPFGDSSLDEMCFAGLSRYPEGGVFLCTN